MKHPRFSLPQIWNMSFGFLGIQFGFALQNANASRILQTFGANVEHLSWFWLAAPLTGMHSNSIRGYYSDRTWTRLGRRKPYFLAGAILNICSSCFHAKFRIFIRSHSSDVYRCWYANHYGCFYQRSDGTVQGFSGRSTAF
ncbi:MAG: MFS transporter [Coprobacter fastidiosus]